MASIPGLYIYNSELDFLSGSGRIEYRCKSDITIWSEINKSNQNCFVHLTTLEVSSGGGKTTLMNLLYNHLCGLENPSTVRIGPRYLRQNVVFIPQKPPLVRHWLISDLVPAESPYVTEMFDETLKGLFTRRISSISGGQSARVFVASALHRLETGARDANYILLDEAFEGLDIQLLVKALKGISHRWMLRNSKRHLFILLVAHVDLNSLTSGLGNVEVQRIELTREASRFETNREIIPVTIHRKHPA